jgi:hypothetical protein
MGTEAGPQRIGFAIVNVIIEGKLTRVSRYCGSNLTLNPAPQVIGQFPCFTVAAGK